MRRRLTKKDQFKLMSLLISLMGLVFIRGCANKRISRNFCLHTYAGNKNNPSLEITTKTNTRKMILELNL